MAYRTEVCPACGGIVDIEFGSRWLGKLVHSESHSCRKCDHRIELDGEPDENSRRLELKKDGVWTLNVQATAEQVVDTLLIICRFVPFTIAEIAEVKSRIPGRALEGTEAEMKRLHHYLSEAKISCLVERRES